LKHRLAFIHIEYQMVEGLWCWFDFWWVADFGGWPTNKGTSLSTPRMFWATRLITCCHVTRQTFQAL